MCSRKRGKGKGEERRTIGQPIDPFVASSNYETIRSKAVCVRESFCQWVFSEWKDEKYTIYSGAGVRRNNAVMFERVHGETTPGSREIRQGLEAKKIVTRKETKPRIVR